MHLLSVTLSAFTNSFQMSRILSLPADASLRDIVSQPRRIHYAVIDDTDSWR